MGMNLIEELGLEKCQAIVDGAPDWAVFWVTLNEYHISMLSFPNMTGQQSYLISDLRAAIADHNRTDYVSDIRNHISPMTKVIEHEQKPKQEVKHGFYDSNCW